MHVGMLIFITIALANPLAAQAQDGAATPANVLHYQGFVGQDSVAFTQNNLRVTLKQSPERGDAARAIFELSAEWNEGGDKRASSVFEVNFPETLTPAAAGKHAIACRLSSREIGEIPATESGSATLYFRANLYPPTISKLQPPDVWPAARDGIGVGTIRDSSEVAEAGGDDWLFQTPGRMDGPAYDGVLTLELDDSTSDEIAGMDARWYLPIRVGLSRHTSAGVRDWGRSLYIFAVYGSDDAPYTGPGPADDPSDALRIVEPPTQSIPEAGGGATTSFDPSDPQVEQWIDLWLTVAEPPENATELDQLHFDSWGRKVGLRSSGQVEEFDAPPTDAPGKTPHEYAWSHRTELDSVDHCTLEEYVAAHITGQDTSACRGRYVRLEPAEVPTLAGLTADDAALELEHRGLRAEFKVEGDPPDEAHGRQVQSQHPEAGVELKPGEAVQLTIFDEYKPPPAPIPDWRGQDGMTASDEAEKLGMRVFLNFLESAPSPEQSGKVYDQQPAAQTILAPGSTVELDIYKSYQPSLKELAEGGDVEAQAELAERYFFGRKIKADEKLAFQWATRAAQRGNAKAQYRLGYIYENGRGVQRDYVSAIHWYRKAADQNQTDAMNDLAFLYMNGAGVDKNLGAALTLLRRSAESGDIRGQYHYAQMLRDGQGTAVDERQAAEYLQKAADKNFPPAQRDLAEFYASGRGGLKQDERLAAQWYEKAAVQKDGPAALALARMYEEGRGVERSVPEALYWYQEAAERHEPGALIRLGYFYCTGQGVERDPVRGLGYYRAAADRGSPVAQYAVGYAYENGIGVTVDYVQANVWYRRAAEKGNLEACYKLGVQYYEGRGARQSYADTYRWFLRAAERGHTASQSEVGRCYHNGWGVERNSTLAAQWYRKAAEGGNSAGQSNLGYCYEHGDGVEQSYSTAAEWYRKSADQGYSHAQYYLGSLYERGKGVKRDYQAARELFEKAAASDHAGAMYELGRIYSKGHGVKKDYTAAAKWFRQAAERGHADSQYELGKLYEDGKGVPKDKAQARRWWQAAAAQGHEDAKDELD